MYNLVSPLDSLIYLKVCYNRNGNPFTHPFIGGKAIARRLQKLLIEEFGIECTEGQKIPVEFYEHYDLIEVSPDYEDDNFDHFVTSDYWYSYNNKLIDLGIEL